MMFGKKKCSIEDIVWVSRDARLAGVVREVTSCTAAGISCLVTPHFADVLESLREALQTAGVRLESIESRIDAAVLANRVGGAPASGAFLVLSEMLAVRERRDAGPFPSDNLRVIAVERYPTGARDEAILAFAEACSLRGPLRFHSSLDDPLFKRFGGELVTSLWKTLGGTDAEPIESHHISSAILAAQKRVRKESIADERVSSSEDWFKYNLRRGK